MVDRFAGDRGSSLHLVRSIVCLAHGLGFRVVGEGIETRALQESLAAIGCDEGQGYGIARPLSAAALVAREDARRSQRGGPDG